MLTVRTCAQVLILLLYCGLNAGERPKNLSLLTPFNIGSGALPGSQQALLTRTYTIFVTSFVAQKVGSNQRGP